MSAGGTTRRPRGRRRRPRVAWGSRLPRCARPSRTGAGRACLPRMRSPVQMRPSGQAPRRATRWFGPFAGAP